MSTPLDDEVDFLVGEIINKQQFEFHIDSYNYSYLALKDVSVIELQSKKIKIKSYDRIMNKIVDYFVQKQQFHFNDKPNALIAFLSFIEEYFKSDTATMGISFFMESAYAYCALRFVREGGGNLVQLSKHLSTDNHSIYYFNRALPDILKTHVPNTNQLIQLFERLEEKLDTKDPTIPNIDLMELGNIIRKTCFLKKSVRNGIISKTIKSNPPKLKRYHSNILLGLLDADLDYLKLIKELRNLTEFQHIIVATLRGAVHSESNGSKEISEFISIVENIESPTDYYYYELVEFYFAIIQQSEKINKKTINQCFKKIKHLIITDTPDLSRLVVEQLKFVKGHEKEVFEIIKSYISSVKFSEGSCESVLRSCYNHSDLTYYFDILRLLILKLTLNFGHREVSNMHYVMRSKHPIQFDELLIKLIIDDIGIIRHIGNRILVLPNLFKANTFFSYNIHDLPAIDQYKLCLSISDSLSEPIYILQFILPLLESEYPLVVDLLLHKLEIMSENYGNSVLEVMESNIDLKIKKNNQCYEQIQQHLLKFHERLDLKRGLKELDPWYTQCKYIQDFFTISNQFLSETLDKSSSENSIFSKIATNVILAKGGGFKTQEGSIGKLSKITTSKVIPREYVVTPELFDWQNIERIKEDWHSKFEEWEVIISLSENI